MKLPDISDEDIDKAEAQWRLPKPLDAERRDILRSMETVDIRACPGGGKTTLLVIKLGILASKWGHRNRGVCVLSHTNVASREIERQFGKISSLRALTQYPHYVGTIQSFLHEFLATPGVFEKFRVRPVLIDNLQYEIEAKREFFRGTKNNGPYATANTFIRNSIRNNPAYTSVGDYASRYIEYVDENLSLPRLGTLNQPVRWESQTGMELQSFKQSMSQQGMFRYQDMAAFAAWYLKRHPRIARLLQERFPIVFFDEMQDTILKQGQLLDTIFSERSVVQRFGDDRQAIYHSTSDEVDGAHFPRGRRLPMRESFRLSCSIAFLSQSVCADDPPEQLIGDKDKSDRAHTIFVFKRDRIKEVLPAFCHLVIKEVGPGLDSSRVRALGANSKGKEGADKFPSAIGDYWPDFIPRKDQVRIRLTTLLAYLEKARTEIMTSGTTREGRRLLLEVCAKILRLQQVTDKDRPVTSASISYRLREKSQEDSHKLNTLLSRTCQRILRNERLDPSEFADELLPLLTHFNSLPWNADVEQFIRDTRGAVYVSENCKNRLPLQDNVFHYECEIGTVLVQVNTIHSAKGETLTAVLLLETIFHEHDLKVLIEKGYLKGESPPGVPGKRIADHLKRIYVAMTRPTDLLCLAICDEHITEANREALTTFGWIIQEVG